MDSTPERAPEPASAGHTAVNVEWVQPDDASTRSVGESAVVWTLVG